MVTRQRRRRESISASPITEGVRPASARFGLLALTMVLAWLSLVLPAFATPDQQIFGPKQYVRMSGAPNEYTDTITVPAHVGEPVVLHIVNGQSNGQNRISSAWITVNNVQVAGPADFGQNVAIVDRTITLNPGTNQLTVKVASTPGAYLTVSVYGTKILPTPTALSPNPLNLTAGAAGTLTATIAPAPTVAGSLTLTSNNTGVATVPSSVNVAVNQTSIGIPVTAVAVGNAQITATLNGGSVSATVDVSAAPPTIASLQPASKTITQGGTGDLTVLISAAQSSPTTITLSSSTSSIASVPASVTVLAGQTSVTIPVSANTPGTSIITASLNGTSATSTITVTANLPTIVSLVPATTSLNLGATGTLTVTISAVQASATSIPVTVSPTGIVTVPATVTVPVGQLTTTIPVTAAALGTAMVHVSLHGSMAESAVQVTPPPPAIVSLLPSPLPVVIGANGTLTVTLNAGQLTNTEVSLTVSPAAIVQIPAVVTVPAGQTSAAFTVTGLAVGSATVTASVNGTTQSAIVQVQPPPPAVVSLLPNPLPLQQGATGSLTLTINAAQVSETVIPLTNSAATIVQVPASITVPANQLSAVIPVTALLAGSATITAAINSSTVSAIVQVTPPPPVVSSLTPLTQSVPKGRPGIVTVTLSRAPTDVTVVTLTSSAPNVAQVPASVTVAAGALSADFPVNTVGEGTATITASLNGGSATATVTVTAPELVLLTLSPQDLTLFVGETQPMTATATLTDGTQQNLTTDSRLVWASTNQTVATIASDGVVTAQAVGASTIRATFTPATGTPTIVETSLTVLTPPALTLTATPTTVAVGQALSVTVTSARMADIGGLTVTITSSGTGAVSHATTVIIPENQTTTTVIVTGVTVGTVTLTATAPIRTPGTLALTVNPSAAPVVLGLTPLSGPTGTVVTLTGLNFFPQATDTVVRLNGLALALTTVSPTQAVFTVPAGATSGFITVTTPLGTATTAQAFVINRPPVLDPIGNKTVALGSTLTFTATAVDPDGQSVTLAATPMPLMPHATFNTQTGLFVFTPDATQVGTFPLTITARDGLITVSESITITVTGAPPGGTTGLSGRVVDGSGQPIANMVVTVKATGQAGTTNTQGIFTINGVAATGRQVLLANGAPLGYAILAAPVDLIPNVMNTLGSELRVPVVDTAHAVTVNPAATTVISNPTLPNTTVTIAPGTAKNPDGTNFTGALSISPVPEYGRPESRPVELKPGFSITIQPAGITLTTPAPITLPNTDNLPPGNQLDLWSLSPDTGTFYVAGRMRVSADGSKLETISGGVRKTAWHFALSFVAQLINDLNRIIGGCTTCTINSGGDLTEGTLTQDITIPGVRTLGISRDLTLQYNSTTADVQPILPIAATLDVRAAVPVTFSADLTVGGLRQGTRGVWDASVMAEQATSSTRMGVSYDGAALPTGRYPYELVTYSNYAQSSVGAVTNGATVLRNEQASPFGAGWGLMGVDRIVLSSGLAILAQGTGQTIPFASAPLTGLVSWWPAEGTAQDLQSAFNGTLQGGTTFGNGSLGTAFHFDGIDDFVSIPHTAAHTTPHLTVGGWVFITQAPATGQEYYLMSKYDGNLSGWIIRMDALQQVALSVSRPPDLAVHAISRPNLPLNTWVHVAGTYDGTTANMYINGVLQGTATLDGGYSGATVPMVLGKASWAQAGFVKGHLDGVEVYNRALSNMEINDLYTSGGRRDLTAQFIAPPSESSTLTRNPDGTYTRRLKDGTVYQFNAQGYQTSLADRNGNTTTYAYNGSNQLTTITDPTNQITMLAYSGTRLATITDPAGRITTLTHDSAGNLIAIDAPDQTRTSFNYDAQHRMVQKRDARGQVSAYQFDSAGRLKKATLANGDSREIRPTDLTGVPDLANGSGVFGNPATIQQPPVIQATFKDAKGQTTTFETDAIGRVTKQIDPLNRTTLIERDPQGNPTKITRPNGAVTTMTYDAKNNLLTSTEQSIAATTTFVYEPVFNQVTRITDPKGNQTNIAYDAKGNPITITDADNKVTRFFYNAQGLLTETRDALYPTNPATTFTYDTLGRLLTTTDPLNRTTTLTYDSAGNVATSKDHLNRITSFEYDAKNRLKKVIDPLLGETVYTYDGNGNLLTVKDAKNQVTTFAYDSRNRLISTTDPLGKVETYEYDGNDNLTKRHTPKGDDILFAYNAVNELLSKTLPGNVVTSYTYSAVGNLLTVTDPDSALTMTYDQANRLLTTSTAGSSNQPSVTLTYTYDKNGNRLTLNGGTASHTYVYDVLNRLTSVTTPTGAATFAYDPLSRRTSLTLPNGTSTTYTYDPASQVTNILHQITASATQINKADYLYNGVGNRTSLTDRRGAQSFGYDNLDRLTSASHPLLGTPQAFTYDAVGNRTTVGNVTNAGNQLTADATHSYQYDDNGNLTRKTLLATGNYTQYTYDAENRLTKVEDFVAGASTPAFTSTYRYDGLGRRIEKVANGQTKRYIYDGEDILLEYDGTNSLVARYTHGPGIDEPIAVTKGSNTFFYHQDGLGSVTDLTDSAGATAKSYSYDAYGNILESPGTVEQPYMYTGREFDSESGLYYYRARYYDPSTGRFLQKDPVGLTGGINSYGYVINNPVNLIDPFGLAPSFMDCFIRCVSEHYGIEEALLRTIVGINAIPIPKSGIGVPRLGGTSGVTNLLSRFGQRFTSDPKLGTQTLGTNRLFGLLGRLNLALGVGLLTYDAVSIGLCIDDCMNEESCDVDSQSNP